jgi:hypothetical protein
MSLQGLGEMGFPIDRLNAHLSHEGPDMASPDLVASIPQCIPDPPRPQGGLVQVDPVDEVHELSALLLTRTGT